MSARHGIAGAVFLVLITGPVVQAQVPTDLPYFKPPSTDDKSDNPEFTAPGAKPTQPGQTPTATWYPQGQEPYGLLPGQQAPPGFMPGQGAPPEFMPGPTGNMPGTPRPPLFPPATTTVSPGQMPGQQMPGQLTPLQAAYGNDSWLYGDCANCCGPIGSHGPIGTELYARTGPSFIVGGGTLASALRTGWDVEGGGRSLFYSTDGHRAWIIDASLSYTANGGDLSHKFQGLIGPADQVTIHFLNRTAVHLGLGHDWWFCGPGDVGSFFNPNFRFGFDGGGTYGTSHVDLNSPVAPGLYERIQKVYGGAYAGVHFDMEVPLGAWTFVTGVRVGWTDDFLHVLPGNNTIEGINLLWNVGVRY